MQTLPPLPGLTDKRKVPLSELHLTALDHWLYCIAHADPVSRRSVVMGAVVHVGNPAVIRCNTCFSPNAWPITLSATYAHMRDVIVERHQLAVDLRVIK